MDLGGILLSEISQAEKEKYYVISLICKQKNKPKKKNELINTENRLVVTRGGGREWEI